MKTKFNPIFDDKKKLDRLDNMAAELTDKYYHSKRYQDGCKIALGELYIRRLKRLGMINEANWVSGKDE